MINQDLTIELKQILSLSWNIMMYPFPFPVTYVVAVDVALMTGHDQYLHNFLVSPLQIRKVSSILNTIIRLNLTQY